MYTKMNKAIDEYINTEFTDYGLMITGDWGCGKTFYLNNELITLLKQEPYNLKPIVVSLNGLSNINHVLNKVLLETYLEKDNKVTKQIKKFDLNALTKTSNKIPKIGSIINILSESTLLYKNYNFENIILIIDDLERTTLNISEILGYITETFINKNVKTIIFGNEKEIIGEDYLAKFNKIKEKTFRKVIKFTVDDAKLINTFIESKHKENSKLYTIIISNEKLITELYSKLDEKNLRTIDFAISILEKIIDVLNKLKASDKIINKIFSIILVLSIEHKKGNLSLSNPEKIKEIKSIDKFYHLKRKIKLNHEAKEEKNKDFPYRDVFSKTYLEDYHIEYNPLISLIDYITTGFLDEMKLEEELINFYDLNQTKAEKTIIQIRNFREYNQIQLDKNIDFIFINLSDIKLLDSLELYSNLVLIKEEVYKKEWKYTDIHERFNKYLNKIKDIEISNDNLFAIKLPIYSHNLNSYFKKSAECTNYLKKLNKKYDQIIFAKKKKLYTDLFYSMLDDKHEDFSFYQDKIDNYDRNNLYKNFVAFDLLYIVPKANYMVVAILKSFLHYNILRVTNAGDFHFSEIEPLKEIKNKFKNVKSSDLVLIFQINQLISDIDKAIHHLENSRKNNDKI